MLPHHSPKVYICKTKKRRASTTDSFFAASKHIPSKHLLHCSFVFDVSLRSYRDVSLIYQCCSAYDEKVNLSAIHTVASIMHFLVILTPFSYLSITIWSFFFFFVCVCVCVCMLFLWNTLFIQLNDLTQYNSWWLLALSPFVTSLPLSCGSAARKACLLKSCFWHHRIVSGIDAVEQNERVLQQPPALLCHRREALLCPRGTAESNRDLRRRRFPWRD